MVWKNKYSALTAPTPVFTVLVAAAGSGQRMGGVYKPMVTICGKPMICHSLEVFENNAYVKQIVISASEERIQEVQQLVKEFGIKKVKCVVAGGSTRTDSVRKAFQAAFASKQDVTPFVAVHDAARPLITDENLNDIFKACITTGAAVGATKVRDALKHSTSDKVADKEVDRSGLWQIQTPQAFDTDIFHTSLVVSENNSAVDDASLVMNAGFKVSCVECGFSNFKVTYPDDLNLAEAIISARKEGKQC